MAVVLVMTGCAAMNEAAQNLNKPMQTPGSQPNSSNPASSAPAPAESASASGAPASASASTSASSPTNAPASASAPAANAVVINGKTLNDAEMKELAAMLGTRPVPGNYWYDARSGLYGLVGHGAGGVAKAGLNAAPLARDASNGDTSILVNGREITRVERDYLIRIFGGDPGNVYQYVGAYDLDAKGNLSKNGAPLGNVVQRAKAAQSQSVNTWQTKSGVSGGSGPGCSWVYIPNSTTGTSTSVMSGCD